MVFKRKIYDMLLEWKNSPVKNSALLIEGARRIGKSTIVEEFGKREYDDYLLIDFMYVIDEVKNLFKDLSNLDLFFSRLFLLLGKTLKKGSLIIFDEVQFCPLARQSIKKLVKDGRYDYIETGSLLSIRDNTINISIPSEERRIEMFPMDYEEFLWAFDDESTANLLRQIYNSKDEIDNSTHHRLMNNFRLYLALGGMPKVISIFKETNSFIEAEKEKQDIIKLYKDDLLKHDLKYGTSCRLLYNNLVNELNNNNSRFRINKIFNNPKKSSLLYDSLFDLSESKVCNVCYESTDPSYGLELSKRETFFKLYSSDIGLMTSLSYDELKNNIDEIYKQIMFDRLNTNLGKLFESVVCQGLVSLGINPYYHTYTYLSNGKEKKYEIDFMVQIHGSVVAIEVKSGTNFTTSSLDQISEKYKGIKFKKIVISTKPFKTKDNIVYLPMYMLFCLK